MAADVPGLEERVTALEAALANPLRAYIQSWTPLTEPEEAELRESIAEAAELPPRVIPQPPPLSPDEIRHLLRECVTVVKPGETLILRVPWSTEPTQVRELQKALQDATNYIEAPFKVLVLPGDELTIAEPPSEITTHFAGNPAAVQEYLNQPGNRETWAKALKEQ